jgi:hypothetical protein
MEEDVDVEAAMAEIGRGILKDPYIGGRLTATLPNPITRALQEGDQGGVWALDMGPVEVDRDVTVERPTPAIRK